ncbi:MAG TPA: hypothetical protein VG692_07305 [Gemmatimonadales bacterium]|nr:hypothetical protein [Gemmatimonadales bacterium]
MRRSTLVLAALATAPAVVAAQTPYAECNQPLITISQQNINICNAAIDGANLFHPVAGLLVSGGNPVLGSFKGLGGFGHFSLTARVNATRVRTPDLGFDGTSTTVDQADKTIAPAPLVEAGLGVFKGVNGFLSIDLLGSAQLIPADKIDNFSVDKDARKIGSVALGLGYGARVGVLPGRAIIPSVVVSVMRRDIPRIAYGNTSGGDNYAFSVDLHATNLRAVAGYDLGLLSVGAGLGYDKYTSDARITFENQNVPGTISVKTDLDNSRTSVFANVGINLSIVKLAAEAGYQLGKDDKLKTTFTGNNPKDSRLFAGAGLTLAF